MEKISPARAFNEGDSKITENRYRLENQPIRAGSRPELPIFNNPQSGLDSNMPRVANNS
jgi:hypothetical protein